MTSNIGKNVKYSILTILKKIRNKAFRILNGQYATLSYSQEGEDLILKRIFEGKFEGFYVDVGAHHPFRFSNTYLFYKKGWTGINIEPNPEVVANFKSGRPNDINLQIGVSEENGVLQYHYFDEPALNTFDVDVVKERLATTPYKVVKMENISVLRLDEILSKNLPVGQVIDFLSIDVEGLDFMVLKSNDWDKYRPTCVLVEVLNSTLEDVINGEIYIFMKNNSYSLFSRTYNTLIFRDHKK